MSDPRRRILVVEDENIIAMDLQMTLEASGFEVPATIATAEEVIERVEELAPDLILMDIQLRGELDGIDAAANIRERLPIPIVFLTANADEATVARARPTTPAGYLIKPFEDRDLQVMIEMALARSEVERQLAESRHRMEATLRSIGEAVIATDLEGRIEIFNPRAETLSGVAAAEAIGQSLADVLPLWRSEGSAEAALLVEGRDERIIEESVTPILDAQGRARGAVHALRDVTERREAELQRESLMRDLTRSNAELEQFASVASHDLQEPLRKIRMFGDRLRKLLTDDPADRALAYLARMDDAASRMSALILDLLELSRVTSAKPSFERVDLGAIAKTVVSDLEDRIERSGGRVEIGELPTLEASPMQMHRLLLNLIGNGLKFHAAGKPPVVRVQSRSTDAATSGRQAKRHFELIVEDDGIGFEFEYAARVFHPFERLHGKTRYEGTGIGLAICKRIAERHAGSIRAESEVGKGARFVVTLPENAPY